MIDKTLSHYRIVEKIGAGGMGEVYRAHDEHLRRDVAVKVLPAGTLQDEQARKRFRREAETISKLNHPHIATVYDFDIQEGLDFLVMELVEGESLAQKLTRASLSEKEIAQVGAQIADALQEAHEHHVVHRDLKPGNIKLTSKGQVKILDFGLAKLLKPVAAATPQSSTEAQAIVGTMPYMSPEQLRGEPVDARSDLYSFGVVLYEMATGRRPFADPWPPQLMAAILQVPPSSPRALNRSVSMELERIILKCLQKEPENRYQSAKELLVDLRQLGAPATARVSVQPRRRLRPTLALGVALSMVVLGVAGYFARQRFWPQATPPAGKVMLAVLPFDNLSGDPEQEFFSDGITEEMIATLGRLQPARLGVIARTSVMLYKDSAKAIDQIGHELGVDYILEGSVRREADRVRITAQLIQVNDQTHRWAESYEQELASVLAVQSEVARQVAQSLALELLPTHDVSTPTVNPEAYEAYLMGRYYLAKRTSEALKKGLEHFQQSVEEDPTFAAGFAWLASAYNLLPSYAILPPEDAFPKARAAAMKALELDDTLAEAHVFLALILFEDDRDFLNAENEFKLAIQLNPNLAFGHRIYSTYLSSMGRHHEAIVEAKRAQELDPLSLITNVYLGASLYYARQYDQAIEQLHKALEFDPKYVVAHRYLGYVYAKKGMYEEAIGEFKEGITDSEGSALHLAGLGYAYALAGRKIEALKVLAELKESSKQSYVPSLELAIVYAGLGDKDQAFAWLEKASQERYFRVLYLKVDPRFDSLRSDPRFQSLLRRLNLPE